MTLPDCINGTFELLGGLFIVFSILKLYRDKVVRGVSRLTISFFLTWGVWNLYYYPYLGQTLSFIGGCFLAATQGVYFAQTFWYGKQKIREWTYDIQRPRTCTDLIVSRMGREPEVLLVRRGEEPFKGQWCVPGGRVLGPNEGCTFPEHPTETARRKLSAECGVDPLKCFFEIVDARSDICDDPRGWFISILFRVKVPTDAVPRPGRTEDDVRFFPLSNLPESEMVPGFADLIRLHTKPVPPGLE